LVASADRDFSGDLGLDEFMDLIHNDGDAMNVNMKSLKKLQDQKDIEQAGIGGDGGLVNFL
jgi:hypothetical protein